MLGVQRIIDGDVQEEMQSTEITLSRAPGEEKVGVDWACYALNMKCPHMLKV